MHSNWLLSATLAAAALAGGGTASAQVRVVIDGRVQTVPDGVVRVVSWRPGGEQIVRDEPFDGPSSGAATITNTETVEQDGSGRPIGITIVTRIEPMRIIAGGQMSLRRTYAPPPPAPAFMAPPAAPAAATVTASAAPTLASWSGPAADAMAASSGKPRQPETLRIRRDPNSGHFITTIRINGVAIRAIVDTGAANTILAPGDARASGVAGEIVGSQRMVGVGGYTMLNIARVRSLEVGGQDLGGMSTPVGQEGLGFTLLGQSEIARLGRIVIEDGTMTITPRPMQISSR